ncbi:hypothetical protein [Kibdelosporangium aridum]|uniref:hypothetical protein n=1 Tax=Kibdelosporangium aridum TaxID=2030 RepID=UPI0005262D24
MSDELFRNRVTRNLWRVPPLAVAVLLAAFAWGEPVVAVFAAAPVLIWCLLVARSARTGLIVSAILFVPVMWILLPRVLDWHGRWVPSVFEVLLFLPILTALICVIATRGERSRLRAIGLSLFLVVGLFSAGIAAFAYDEGLAHDEGVLPVPSDLRLVSNTSGCGSQCLRVLVVTGDHATDRMREHLRAQGYTNPGRFEAETCRVTGLVLPYKVCVAVSEQSPTQAMVEWYI